MELGCHNGKKHKHKQAQGYATHCDGCYLQFGAPMPLECPRCGRKARKAQSHAGSTETAPTMAPSPSVTTSGTTSGTTSPNPKTSQKLSMPALQAKPGTSVATNAPKVPSVEMHAQLASMLQQSGSPPPSLQSLQSLLTGEPLPELIFGKSALSIATTSPAPMPTKARSVQDLVYGKPPSLPEPRTVGDFMKAYKLGTPYGSFGSTMSTNNNTNGPKSLPLEKHGFMHSHNHSHNKSHNPKMATKPYKEPELNEEGLPRDMFGSRNDALHRLALEQKYLTHIESPSLRALMQTGQVASLAMATTDTGLELGCVADLREDPRCVEAHLKSCHPDFYALLERFQLLGKAREGCVMFVLPQPKVLRQAALTRQQVMAHIGRMPDALDLVELVGMVIVPTLTTRTLQLEARDGELTVNGVMARTDERFPAHIVHVPQVLDTSDAQLALPPPMDGASPEEEGQLVVDKGGPEPPDYPPPVYVEEQEVQSTSSAMSQVHRDSVFGHTALRQLTLAMNEPRYNGSIDMSAFQNTERSVHAEPVQITLQHYDTASAYARYEANQLPRTMRLAPAKRVAMTFRGAYQKHLVFGQGMDMCEYTVHMGTTMASRPTRQQLERGLVSLSFSSPSNRNETTLLLTRLVPSEEDRNTYMTQNEAVMLRFEQDVLHTIAINHKHTMTPYEALPDEQHFLQWSPASTTVPRGLSAADFDALLLGEGVVKRLKRRAKKAATKGARKVKNAVQSKQKSVLALKLRPVPNPDVLTNALRGSGSGAPGQMSVTVYDSKMQVDLDSSVQGLATKRYAGAINVYDIASNSLASVAQRQATHLLSMQLGPLKFDLNVDDVSSDTSLYYAQDGEQVYIVQFEGVALRRIALLSSKTGLYVDMKRQ